MISRERLGKRDAFTRGCWLARNMAMHPLQRIGGAERQSAREHLVQGDAQRVEVAARIDRAVHPASLFRRHVSERAGNDLRRRGRLALVRQPGRDPESGEPDVAEVVDKHVRRLDVFVDHPVAVDLTEGCHQADRDAQNACQLERVPRSAIKDPIQGFAARVLEHEHRPPFVTSECHGQEGPRRIKFGRERVFMLEPPKALRRWLICSERYRQDGDRAGRPVGPGTG